MSDKCDYLRCRQEPFIGVRDTAKHSKNKDYNLCHKHWLELCGVESTTLGGVVRDFCAKKLKETHNG